MKFKRQDEEDFSLQLTALIDVVFLLLIFFMVSTAFIDFTRRMDIEVPEVKAGSGVQRERVYEIEMALDSKVYLNGVEVDLDSLADRLREKNPEIVKRSAIIRADRKLDYGSVAQVIGLCKNADILDIAVAVQ